MVHILNIAAYNHWIDPGWWHDATKSVVNDEDFLPQIFRVLLIFVMAWLLWRLVRRMTDKGKR